MDNEMCPGEMSGHFLYLRDSAPVIPDPLCTQRLSVRADQEPPLMTFREGIKSNRLICFPIPGRAVFLHFPVLSRPPEYPLKHGDNFLRCDQNQFFLCPGHAYVEQPPLFSLIDLLPAALQRYPALSDSAHQNDWKFQAFLIREES